MTNCPYCGASCVEETVFRHVMLKCSALVCDCIDRWKQDGGAAEGPQRHHVECAVHRAAVGVLPVGTTAEGRRSLFASYRPLPGRAVSTSTVAYVPSDAAAWTSAPAIFDLFSDKETPARAEVEVAARQVAECFSDKEPLVLMAAGVVAADRIVALKQAIKTLDGVRAKARADTAKEPQA